MDHKVGMELNTGFAIYIMLYIVLYFSWLRKKPRKEKIWLSLLIIYLFMVMDATILPIPLNRTMIDYNFSMRGHNDIWQFINLIPNFSFQNIMSRNFFLNMVMFAPFGFLINQIFIKDNRFKKTLIYALIFTVSIEFSQFLLIYFTRSFKIVDIDDIFANVFSALIGLLIYI